MDPSAPTPGPSGGSTSGKVVAAIGNLIDEVPVGSFAKFLKISAKRAFRLRIEPSEVLPSERYALTHANPPVVEPNLQAFLAWRRSVLFLVACALVPLTVVGLWNASTGRMPDAIRMVKLLPALAEALFLLICWWQLRNWQHWRKQRRWLFWGWLLFLLTPFVVFAFPLQSVLDHLPETRAGWAAKKEALLAMGFDDLKRLKDVILMPFMFAMLAMLQLAPKAISLMPGLVRASMVIKLLFPGSSTPGWLIAMAAPMYALLAYVILIVPYQFTGEELFMMGVMGVVFGQFWLARAGFALARPMDEAQALAAIKRVRKVYLITMIMSAVFIIVALWTLVKMVKLRMSDVALSIMKFESNVLMLTLVGADLVVTNLDRARSNVAGNDHIEEATIVKIAAFVGLDAPPVPPPKH